MVGFSLQRHGDARRTLLKPRHAVLWLIFVALTLSFVEFFDWSMIDTEVVNVRNSERAGRRGCLTTSNVISHALEP